MGTSSDYGGGKGGAWTPFKHAATDYAKYGGTERGRRVLARHVATLGGVGGAVASANAGITAAQRVAGLFSGVGSAGLDATLQAYALGALVGRDRFEVLEALIDLVAPSGADLDGQAARSAACDVIDEIFRDAESYDELAGLQLDADGVRRALELFLSAYVYNRALPVIEQRLAKLDQAEAERRDHELRDFIIAIVRLQLAHVDPFSVAWESAEGRRLIDEVLTETYRQMEAWE
jgi:hypothetical protein